MSALKQKLRFTVAEYLGMERAARDRHEYLDGLVYAMAGESNAHGIISVNLVGILHNQLRGNPCSVRTKDTKVRSGPTPRPGGDLAGLYSYPDVLVVCDEPIFHDKFEDVILNPRVIFEVLSESTEEYDRGEKSDRYRMWLPTLCDYFLVSQDRPQVEQLARQADGTWSNEVYTGLDAVVPIPSIQCTLKLTDVYERVVFPQGESSFGERGT